MGVGGVIADLPDSWCYVPLANVARINPGVDKSRFSNDEELPFVPMPAVEAGTGRIDTSERRPFEKVKSGFTAFASGDVLFAKITPCMENGKMAVVPELPRGAGFGTTEFHVLRPSNAVDARLLYYFVSSASVRHEAQHNMTGAVGQKRVPKRFLETKEFPLPPLNEQHRIVEKIESLFARIDKGEEALREVQKLLKRYRQSILKAAVTGELTCDWREANQHKLEPASDLLARILETRRENWQGRGKYKEPAASDATQYYELPECWALSSTEQLAYVETGATPKKSESGFYSSEGTPWITSTAVNEDPIRTPQAHITERAMRETNAKLFPTGALVVGMYGEGKTRGKVSELGIDSASNQACAALLVQHLPSEVARYLKLFYLYNYEAIRRQSAGGVQPNLNLSLIKATQVPLPPEQEVGEILTRVNVELSTVQELERTCSTELARSTALRQSILRSAFTGKLVPQDRNDEPASKLLARIRRGNDQ